MEKLRILHIEDSPADAGLIERQLIKAGFNFEMHLIESKQEYVRALEEFRPDVILSDHSLPQFDSLEALAIYAEKKLAIPFILVTGSVSEEFAIRTIKEGADDYILKNNMIRLPSAITQALKARNLEAERRRARLELDETNRELNTFIYKAAHDLRGPLCSIMGLTKVALMERENKKVPDYLNKISDSTQKLDDVLLALIDLMSIREARPVPVTLNLTEMINGILEGLKNTRGFEEVSFSVSAGMTEGFLSDEKILSMALRNIIENTITYRCADGAKTHIRAELTEEGLKIEVEDNGNGIDPGMLNFIFDMYFRGNQYSNGSGLGLYVALTGIRRLGGRIEVQSELSEGSVFTIYVPGQAVLMQ